MAAFWKSHIRLTLFFVYNFGGVVKPLGAEQGICGARFPNRCYLYGTQK